MAMVGELSMCVSHLLAARKSGIVLCIQWSVVCFK